jgi:hypothetical protein
MANVGDLFVNVRARTTALTRGLRSARRSVRRFASSTTGLLSGIAAGFVGFKTFSFIMGSLITGSKEFREEFANIKNAITDAGQVFARQFGGQLASGLSDLSDWIANSQTLREIFEGIGPLFTDVIIPAVKVLSNILEPFRRLLAWMIENVTGTTAKMKELEQGITDPSQIESSDTFRQAVGVTRRTQQGMDFGNTQAGQDYAMKWFRRLDERTAVPR